LQLNRNSWKKILFFLKKKIQKKVPSLSFSPDRMSDAIFARAAQRLDAEYDGGTSDKGDESDDVDDSPTKLETTSSRCASRRIRVN